MTLVGRELNDLGFLQYEHIHLNFVGRCDKRPSHI